MRPSQAPRRDVEAPTILEKQRQRAAYTMVTYKIVLVDGLFERPPAAAQRTLARGDLGVPGNSSRLP